jgi:hypothetical protein
MTLPKLFVSMFVITAGLIGVLYILVFHESRNNGVVKMDNTDRTMAICTGGGDNFVPVVAEDRSRVAFKRNGILYVVHRDEFHPTRFRALEILAEEKCKQFWNNN